MTQILEIDDGILKGNLDQDVQPCDYCGQPAKTIHITSIKLPHGIKPESTILIDNAQPVTEWPMVQHLGITCSCYAKFHRQVAHIEDKIKSRSSNA